MDRRRAGWAAGLSLLAHLLGFLTVSAVSTAPSIDMDFELPAEVEFGLTEGMVADSTPPAAPLLQGGDLSESLEGAEGASVDAGRAQDAGRRRDAGASPDAGVRLADAGVAAADAGTSARDAGAADGGGDAGISSDAGSLPAGEGRIPPGAQLAIRLNMERIRSSPLASEVRRLLTAIPDWHALLDGSGIDPMADLDRLLLASPNLQRDRLVLAGKHHRDQAYAVSAAQRLAASQHATTAFREQDGVRVAPWRNPDPTRRVIALAGEHYFIICRPADLPRVLALMRVRARDQRTDAGVPVMSAADALLAMLDDELMSFEVEGARRFVRAGRVEAMPLAARLSVRQTEAGVQITGQGRFEDAEQARAAREFWAGQVESLARNPMIALVGLATPLRRLSFRVEGERVHFETSLSTGQVRLLLGYLEGLLVQYRRDREARQRASHPRPLPGSPPPRQPAPRPTPGSPSSPQPAAAGMSDAR